MWQGKKSVKDFVRKVYEDDLISKEDLEECLIAYEKEEENILKILSNNDYINWVVTMLEKNSSVGHRDMDDCYEPNWNISEEDKNNILLIEIFIYGIYLYMWDFNTGMWKKDLETKVRKTDDKGKMSETKELVCIRYKDNYYNIGKKIVPHMGGLEYCKKGVPRENYIDF